MTIWRNRGPRHEDPQFVSVISATKLPRFGMVDMETPTPYFALGARGRGSSGTIGSRPAQYAVVDAVAHLDVRHIQMPTTPQRVGKAIAEAQGGISR
jgi:aerobic carbon-monoxide dehydrogenase large subunit